MLECVFEEEKKQGTDIQGLKDRAFQIMVCFSFAEQNTTSSSTLPVFFFSLLKKEQNWAFWSIEWVQEFSLKGLTSPS